MPNYVASIAIDAVITALGAFLQPFVANEQIVRAQVNRVSPPPTAYVLLTELHIIDLETPSIAVEDELMTLTGPAQIDIQVDFYGEFSGDQCKAVKGIYRSIYSTAKFPNGIKPLYCSDGNQSPLITGEEQYESRWTLTASLQYNPTVTVPQETATALGVAVVENI